MNNMEVAGCPWTIPETMNAEQTLSRTVRMHAMTHPLAYLMGALILVFVLVVAFRPDTVREKEAKISRDLESGRIAKVAEAPDGATIWAVQREGKTVYFSKGAIVIPSEDSVRSSL